MNNNNPFLNESLDENDKNPFKETKKQVDSTFDDTANPFAKQQSQQIVEQTTSPSANALNGALDNEVLLNDLKKSIEGMQENMKSTYDSLSSKHVKGTSDDKLIEIEMTATLKLIDIKFDEHAFDDGIKEFKWRLREALSNLFDNMQKTTQEETMRLLQGMEIPDAIRDLNKEEDK